MKKSGLEGSLWRFIGTRYVLVDDRDKKTIDLELRSNFSVLWGLRAHIERGLHRYYAFRKARILLYISAPALTSFSMFASG